MKHFSAKWEENVLCREKTHRNVNELMHFQDKEFRHLIFSALVVRA